MNRYIYMNIWLIHDFMKYALVTGTGTVNTAIAVDILYIYLHDEL